MTNKYKPILTVFHLRVGSMASLQKYNGRLCFFFQRKPDIDPGLTWLVTFENGEQLAAYTDEVMGGQE